MSARVRGVRHRAFDPRRVGALETAAWVAYYRRRWLALLWASLGLTRAMFGLPWHLTLRAAWLIVLANRRWAPYPDNDPAGAQRAMARFYRILATHYAESLDPVRAAELEVAWWHAHRARQLQEGGAEPLIDALAAVYAYVYGASEDDVRLAAAQRAAAMDISDAWVAAGSASDDPRLGLERAALVRSYAALLAAVHR